MVLAAIGLLLAAGAMLVHLTGGTPSVHAHLMYVPIFLASAVYGVAGGLVAGLLAGLMLGPLLGGSLESVQAIMTSWGVRTLWLMAIGAGAGLMMQMIAALGREQRAQALRDPFTGLPNQAALMEDLDAHLAANAGDKAKVAAVLLRATDFADIVEVIGIEDGDRILGEIGEHLSRSCPEVRGCYRFSTSELAFIVECGDRETLKRIARTLHGAATDPFDVDGVPVRIEPAVGLGHVGADATIDAREAVRRTRVALRRAETLERNWVSYEPTLDADASTTLELIGLAEQAIEAGEFTLQYQPKIRLADRRPAGVEALARWRRPNEGLVAPGSFMPKLEQTSLIDTFSRFVVRTATDYAGSGPLLPVSINLAPRNLADERLADALIDGLQQTGTPPECFMVEVTESGIMREPRAAIALLNRLREHGIGVSIDDFGTGYSSFAYLRQLPATELKIDRAFVHPLEGDAKTRRLVLAMIEVGHALDLSVTAEGVETEEQARILTELGCDLGQGFLWSPAVETSALHKWLAAAEPA
ncbi:MAG: bifunctional diguanylate cyclase/phosphodiesterase [Halofilum sp. (in: g-proteobacteria)]